LAIISLKAKVLYFIWKKRGFEANYNNLSRALGYQDERRIRDAVNDSLEDGTRDKEEERERLLDDDEQGRRDVSGYRIPPLSLAGLGIFIIVICAVFWYLQRRLERRIWEVERKKATDHEGQVVSS
jgi:hypothetical protein